MAQRVKTKYVHEGRYVAEVEVFLIQDDIHWSPHLSIDDACKLDDVRDALRQANLDAATRYGQIYEMRPVAS